MSAIATKIIGVSLPRSGHHYLAGMLSAVLGADFEYVWRPVGGEVPSPGKMLFIKNHDHHDDVDPHQRAFYLIQHREPKGRLLSEIERQMARRPERLAAAKEKGREFWRSWLRNQKEFSIRFHDKWLVNPPAFATVVDYRRLTASPQSVVGEIVEAIGRADRLGNVSSVSAELAELRAVGPAKLKRGRDPFRQRNLNDSPYIPVDLLDETVAALRERCPIWNEEEGVLAG